MGWQNGCQISLQGRRWCSFRAKTSILRLVSEDGSRGSKGFLSERTAGNLQKTPEFEEVREGRRAEAGRRLGRGTAREVGGARWSRAWWAKRT